MTLITYKSEPDKSGRNDRSTWKVSAASRALNGNRRDSRALLRALHASVKGVRIGAYVSAADTDGEVSLKFIREVFFFVSVRTTTM